MTIANPYAFAEGVEPVGVGPNAAIWAPLRAQYFIATIDTGVPNSNIHADSLATPGNPQSTGTDPSITALTYAPPGSVDAPGLPGRPLQATLDGTETPATPAPAWATEVPGTPSLTSGEG